MNPNPTKVGTPTPAAFPAAASSEDQALPSNINTPQPLSDAEKKQSELSPWPINCEGCGESGDGYEAEGKMI